MQELPDIPVPAVPLNPPCDWCGKRPAGRYEVAPASWGVKKQADAKGVVSSVRVMKKHATVAYVCRRHRDIFDRQKQTAAERKAAERPTIINDGR